MKGSNILLVSAVAAVIAVGACDRVADILMPAATEVEEEVLGLSPDQRVFRWMPPKTGTPVVTYEVEAWYYSKQAVTLSFVTENWAALEYMRGDSLRVRVCGVDAEGRRGPWSIWSDTYYDPPLPDIHMED